MARSWSTSPPGDGRLCVLRKGHRSRLGHDAPSDSSALLPHLASGGLAARDGSVGRPTGERADRRTVQQKKRPRTFGNRAPAAGAARYPVLAVVSQGGWAARRLLRSTPARLVGRNAGSRFSAPPRALGPGVCDRISPRRGGLRV